MIEHQTRMGQLLRESLAASGWRIVNTTPLPVVCFTRDDLDVPAFLAALRREQIAWMSEVEIKGYRFVRACITSLKTTEHDIESVVQRIGGLVSQPPVLASISK
jgi:threonine aldolase